MDALESQLLLETSKVKSPDFSAFLGFFIPALAAFYTRRIGAGILYLIIDFFNLMLAPTGIGVITGILFRLIAGDVAYTWAREINQKEFEHSIAARNSNRKLTSQQASRSSH